MAKKKKEKSFSSFLNNPFDFTLVITILLLLGIGLVMVLSASSPSALSESGNSYAYFSKQLLFAILGIIAGIIMMIFCDIFVEKKFNNKKIKGNSLLKTGIVVSIGLAIHNIPEGLAIGTGFEASMKLGYSLAIAIAIHDIPEGISMAAPMKKGGLKSGKILFYVILSGVTTGLGAFVGAIVGNISQKVIAVCLALAAGAMLYIVSGELTPEYNKLYSGKMSSIGNMIGFILGLIATQI